MFEEVVKRGKEKVSEYKFHNEVCEMYAVNAVGLISLEALEKLQSIEANFPTVAIPFDECERFTFPVFDRAELDEEIQVQSSDVHLQRQDPEITEMFADSRVVPPRPTATFESFFDDGGVEAHAEQIEAEASPLQQSEWALARHEEQKRRQKELQKLELEIINSIDWVEFGKKSVAHALFDQCNPFK